MTRQDERLTFESSHGIIVCDGWGNIKPNESDLSDWLNDVLKIDVEELENYYILNKLKPNEIDGGDVLDFGYWDKGGVYHKADENWRLTTFHNQDIKLNKDVTKLVADSFCWIAKNRKIYLDK